MQVQLNRQFTAQAVAAGAGHKRPRGGSFGNNARNVRSANRNRNDPRNRNDNLGFRVVVAHDTLSLPEILRGDRSADEAF